MHSAVSARPRRAGRLLVPAAVGAVVAIALGVFGAEHSPAKVPYSLGFSSLFAMKIWLAVGAGALALLQLLSALWMWRRLPLGPPPRWVRPAHRATGTLAFLTTLPVAYACLYALGFQHYSTRVLVHSLLGCLFYGAFATKIMIVRGRGLPAIALPLAGGLLFTLLIAAWLTSGLWFITENGFPSP